MIQIFLLPILFMLHEFEEMILLPTWCRRNETELSRRFPALQSKLSFLQSPAFGIAVCEEFIICSACTIITIATGNVLFLVHLSVGFHSTLHCPSRAISAHP